MFVVATPHHGVLIGLLPVVCVFDTVRPDGNVLVQRRQIGVRRLVIVGGRILAQEIEKASWRSVGDLNLNGEAGVYSTYKSV